MALSLTNSAQIPQMISRANSRGSITLDIFSTVLVMPKYNRKDTSASKSRVQMIGSTADEVNWS